MASCLALLYHYTGEVLVEQQGEEQAQAKEYTRRASDGQIPPDETQAWLPGPRIGF